MTTRWQKITWILLIIVAILCGGCTDILLEKGGSIQVSLSMADAPGGRNALAQDGGTQYKVKGWVVDTQGEVIEEVEDYLVDGRGNISFASVEIHMNVRVLIQVYDTNDIILYSGVSDFFVVVPEVNVVPMELQWGDFRKWFGPVGTVEVKFTVEKADWKNLIDFPNSNDLYIRSYILSSDNVVQGESLVAGDFGEHTVTFSNVPAETGTTVSVIVYYNPKQKYTHKELTAPANDVLQYVLNISMSNSFDVKEGTNTVDMALTPYDMGGIAQNGYTHSCSSQEEIKKVIEYATDSVILSLAEDVHITDTITIDKEVSFMPLGDIIDIHVLSSLFWENSAGPMFEVTSNGSLGLSGIILNGKGYTGDDPLIVSEGDLYLYSCELINNNRSSTDKGVVYARGGSLTISNTNITVAENYNGNALYMESGVTYFINNIDNGLVQSYTSITPASP